MDPLEVTPEVAQGAASKRSEAQARAQISPASVWRKASVLAGANIAKQMLAKRGAIGEILISAEELQTSLSVAFELGCETAEKHRQAGALLP